MSNCHQKQAPMKTDKQTFNQRCYELLNQIPSGKVTTYKEIAKALGTKAYRAVGNAMAHNPNLITTPCHRVVKSTAEIGNYALGIEKKIALLEKENVRVREGKVENFEAVFYRF
jgi:methylated-DNA-[protein]-cysteine S-methyltransferase